MVRYNVWSRVGDHWLVVDEGTRKQAEAAVARKKEAAERHMPDGDAEFVALPQGEVPE